MSEAGVTRNRKQSGLVVINHAELVRKLHRRGKNPNSLHTVKAASHETLSRIAKGLPVQAIILRRITAQLQEWPELEHAADLLEAEAI